MADSKLSALTDIGALASGDLFYVVRGTAFNSTTIGSISTYVAAAAVALTNKNSVSSTAGAALSLSAPNGNMPVTLTPGDTSSQGAVTSSAIAASSAIVGGGGFQVSQQATSGNIFPSIEVVGYENGQDAECYLVVARAGGTKAAPATTTASQAIGGWISYAYANGAWVKGGIISSYTSSTFANADTSTSLLFSVRAAASQVNSLWIYGKTANLNIGGTNSDQGAVLSVSQGSGIRTSATAWGVSGTLFQVGTHTVTDGASATGTVVSAMFNSFAIPTLAATSTGVVYTSSATVYIAGAPAAGTHVTITNPYSLYVAAGNVYLGAALTIQTNLNVFGNAILNSNLSVGFRTTLGGSAASGAAWGAAGIVVQNTATTATDTSTAASGTAALASFFSFAAPTLAATNATVTTTDACTVYIGGGPNAGTNQTITRKHSLGIVDTTSAASSITGGFVVAAALGTAATSVGIGGGNVNAGGTIIAGGAITSGGTLTVPGAATAIFTTVTTITSGAASAAGTLTNAPAVGNPTKWMPINDAGTTRYIPAW